MGYGGGSDTVRQTIEVLVQAEGIDALAEVQRAMQQVQDHMAEVTKRFIEQGGPIRDLVPILADLSGEYQRLVKVAETMKGQQNAIAESFVGLPQITEQAGHLADSLTKVDVSLNGLMSSAFKVRGDEITATLRAQAEAARLVEEAEGSAIRARIEGYARTEAAAMDEAAAIKRATIEAMGDRARRHAQFEADVDAEIASEKRLAAESLAAQKQAALEELGVRARMHAQIEAFVDQELASQKTAAGEAMRARIDALTRAEQATDTFNAAQKKLEATTRVTSQGAGDFGRQMLFVSYAMQDLYQGGFASILNNIPQLAMSFGVTGPAVGAVAIAAIGLDVAFKTLGPAARQMAMDIGLIEDPSKKAAATIEDIQQKLKAIESRPHKLDIDYEDIRKAKKELTELQEAEAAYNAGKKDRIETDMGRAASEAIDLYTGGTDDLKAKVREMDQRRKGDPNAFADKDVRDKFEEVQRQNAIEITNPDTGVSHRLASNEQLAKAKDDLEKSIQKNIEAEVGNFKLGNPAAIARMQERAKAEPDNFGQVGPDGRTAAQAIGDLASTRGDQAKRNADQVKAEGLRKRISDALEDEALSTQQRADVVRRTGADLSVLWRKAVDRERDKEVVDDAFIKLNKQAAAEKKKEVEAAKERLDIILNAAGDADDAKKKAAAEAVKALAKDATEAKKANDAAARAGDKALGDELKAGNVQQRARDAEAAKLTPSFERQIQGELLENARRTAAGHPVARTVVDYQAMTMQGLQPAVPPEMQRAYLEQQVGRNLGLAHKDPTLSHEIVGQSGKHLDDLMAKTAAQHAGALGNVVDVQTQTVAIIQATMQTLGRLDSQTRANAGQLRRAAQQGPNLGRRGN